MGKIDLNVRKFMNLLNIESYYMPDYHENYELDRRTRAIDFFLKFVPEADVRIVCVNTYDRYASCSEGVIARYVGRQFTDMLIACISISYKEVRSRTDGEFNLGSYLQDSQLPHHVSVEEIANYEKEVYRALCWRRSVTALNFLVLYPHVVGIEFSEESIQRATRRLSEMYTDIRFLRSRPSEMAAAVLQIECLFRYSAVQFQSIRSSFRRHATYDSCYRQLLIDLVDNLPKWPAMLLHITSIAIIGAIACLVVDIISERKIQETLLLLEGETAERAESRPEQVPSAPNDPSLNARHRERLRERYTLTFSVQTPHARRRERFTEPLREESQLQMLSIQVSRVRIQRKPYSLIILGARTPSEERPRTPESMLRLISSFINLSPSTVTSSRGPAPFLTRAAFGPTLPGPAPAITLHGAAPSLIGLTLATLPNLRDRLQPIRNLQEVGTKRSENRDHAVNEECTENLLELQKEQNKND